MNWDEVLLAFRQYGGKLPKKNEKGLIAFLEDCERREEDEFKKFKERHQRNMAAFHSKKG